MSQKTIYSSSDWLQRLVTDSSDDTLWLVDDLDQTEINMSRDELRAMLPTLIKWANEKVN